MVLLLVMTDSRRECIERTIASAEQYLPSSAGFWPITRRVIHDDSADSAYRAWLVETFPDWEIVSTPSRAGFGGAIRNAWAYLCATADHDDAQFVFHLEDDFTFNRHVDLGGMMAVLRGRPDLVQLALRRQPWNDAEIAAGGVVESNPDAYEEHRHGTLAWLEHRLFMTTNPSLYRRSLCWRGWPDGADSEGRFAHELLADPAARFGYWGARDSGEWVTHIGTDRAGVGY